MEMSHDADTITFIPKVKIESVQTVMPVKPTDRLCHRVSVPENLQVVFKRRVHVVVYYRKASDEDSGWVTAGWIKESLGTALLERPMVSGRLRRAEDGNEPGELEIVSNDSGVRFLEARTPLCLVDFLDAKKDKDEVEAELVFWEDIDEKNPQFSPLCYVQVTNFKCGGYSIGFSCSLLVMDPLAMTSFLKIWADIHNTIVSKNVPKLPLFYLPNLRKTGNSSPNTKGSIPCKDNGQSLIFKFKSSENLINDAALCIEELESKYGSKRSSSFTLIVKKLSGETKVERVSRDGIVMNSPAVVSKGLVCESWNSLGVDEIILQQGNKPVCVSCWINSMFDEGLVMVIPSLEEGKSGKKFIVTIPNEIKI